MVVEIFRHTIGEPVSVKINVHFAVNWTPRKRKQHDHVLSYLFMT